MQRCIQGYLFRPNKSSRRYKPVGGNYQGPSPTSQVAETLDNYDDDCNVDDDGGDDNDCNGDDDYGGGDDHCYDAGEGV